MNIPIQGTVHVPTYTMTSTSSLMPIYTNGAYQGSDHTNFTISLSPTILDSMAMQIIRTEMEYVKEHIEDLEKVQQMIDSEDEEMNNLGYSYLERWTIYTCRIIKAFKQGWGVEGVIEEYISKNRTNITDKIK